MTTLEKEIVEKFQQLDLAAQERVLSQLLAEQKSQFDYSRWWSDIDKLQNSIRKKSGGKVDALSLLDELREEEFHSSNLQG